MPLSQVPNKSSGRLKWVDRIALWPLLVALGVPAAIIVCRASPIGPNFVYVMLGIPGILIFGAAMALPATVGVFTSLWRRAWTRAASYAILPAMAVAIAPQPINFIHFCNGIGNLVHFEIMRSSYESQVKAMPDTGEPKLVVFNWGGMSWASNGVVYDESDELALPPGQQSSAWKARASQTELACEGYFSKPVGGHFYLADFPC